MKIAVIGSGPCGSLAAETLLDKGYEVHLFDIGAFVSNSSYPNNNPNIDPYYVKELKGDRNNYDLDEYNKIDLRNGLKNWFTSKSVGGFSNVWGATWEKHLIIKDQKWKAYYDKIDEKVLGFAAADTRSHSNLFDQSTICSCFQHLISSIPTHDLSIFSGERWQVPQLAIDSGRCTGIGKCINFCPNRAIWSSHKILQKVFEKRHFTYRPNVFVHKIDANLDSISLEFQHHSMLRTEVFSKCILAAGPVANSMLLLRSGLTSTITLRDTRIVKMAFLRLRKPVIHNKVFSLSGLSLTLYSRDYKREFAHIQFYAHIDEFMDRIEKRYPWTSRLTLRPWLQKLSKRLVFALCYVSQEHSDRIELSGSSNPTVLRFIENKYQSRAIIQIYFRLLRLSYKSKLFPIPFLDKGNPGDSYHVGNPIERQDLFDEFGKLKSNSNIYVAGALSLPYLPPGAITRSAMTQTLMLCEEFPQVIS